MNCEVRYLILSPLGALVFDINALDNLLLLPLLNFYFDLRRVVDLIDLPET